ncbi:hypothetical protein Scep_006942 [Stephania cephalantha]|uniref:Uncharacterized protein n=1 Tax=Stephania cephalantha TaxID=152367 RepID=A0AAP0KBL8_9MAGN
MWCIVVELWDANTKSRRPWRQGNPRLFFTVEVMNSVGRKVDFRLTPQGEEPSCQPTLDIIKLQREISRIF